jgi:hypothetical protein
VLKWSLGSVLGTATADGRLAVSSEQRALVALRGRGERGRRERCTLARVGRSGTEERALVTWIDELRRLGPLCTPTAAAGMGA